MRAALPPAPPAGDVACRTCPTILSKLSSLDAGHDQCSQCRRREGVETSELHQALAVLRRMARAGQTAPTAAEWDRGPAFDLDLLPSHRLRRLTGMTWIEMLGWAEFAETNGRTGAGGNFDRGVPSQPVRTAVDRALAARGGRLLDLAAEVAALLGDDPVRTYRLMCRAAQQPRMDRARAEALVGALRDLPPVDRPGARPRRVVTGAGTFR